jgi:hypothetical protein
MSDEPAAVEDRMDRLERKLDELLSAGHAKAASHEETKLGRPTEVQDMVRMELEKAQAEKDAAAEKDAEKTERQSIAQRLAALTEQRPEAPQPRRQRLMWGKR